MLVTARGAPLVRTASFLILCTLAVAPAFSAAPNIWPGKASTTIPVGTAWKYYPYASDADGDTLTYSITNKPAFVSFRTSDGSLSGTPTAQHVGTYGNVVISVTDGKTKVSLPAITITVTGTGTQPPPTTPPPSGTNKPPTISGTPPTAVAIGVQYNFQVSASDPEGKTLTFSVANKPSWATFGTVSGRLHGTPSTVYTGVYPNIIISVSDGTSSASLPPFSITVGNPSGGGNSAPTISGTPQSSVAVGSAYNFQPTASDANSDPLTFSISQKPAWATFSTSTGRLSGTPTTANVGTTTGISIRVSDGKTTTSLPSFAITVNSSSPTTGSAVLNWAPPTRNTDGTTLTNLAGYRISYGRSAGSLTSTVQISNPGVASYVVEGLSSGTWYFALKSYTSTGVESLLSNTVSTTIP